MRTTPGGRPFTIIGENIHATRVVLRSGRRVATTADGRDALVFAGPDGSPRLFALPEAILASSEFAEGKVKHVRAALIAALGDEPAAAEAGRDYLGWLAARQVAAGADFLDLNVDELSEKTEVQLEAMRWLVAAIEAAAAVPLALDSSSTEIIRAGLEARDRSRPAPLLNSASRERLDVLDLAAEHGCPVIASAAGGTDLPTNADERVANALAMVEAATARGVPLDRIHLDVIVLPVAVDPMVGDAVVGSIRQLRTELGPAVHLCGGFSNVSYGLPLRKLVNDVFVDMAVEAGADSGIVDPVASDLDRVFAQDRESPAYRLAADLLTGADQYGMAFLAAYRRGEIAAAG
jgi:5-methyltetrahydrofolate corrinoid/iron sulfur protein methyltransferase